MEFAVILDFSIILSDLVPELGRDDCLLFIFLFILCPQRWEVGGKYEKNLISFVVNLLQSCEENRILIFLKNFMINVFFTLRQRFHKRR